MRFLLAIKARWPVFALLALYAYLTVHTLSGSQGVMRWVDYEQDTVQLVDELAALKESRKALEDEAAALSSKALQLDILDQRARELLYASREDELIIPLPRD